MQRYEFTVVIAKDFDGVEMRNVKQAERYTRELHDLWGVGHRDCGSGVVLGLSTGKRVLYFSTGEAVMKTLDDRTLDKIIGKMTDRLKDNKIDDAVLYGVKEVARLLGPGKSWFERFVDYIMSWIESLIMITFCVIIVFSVVMAIRDCLKSHRRKEDYNRKLKKIEEMEKLMKTGKVVESTICPICVEDLPQPQTESHDLSEQKSLEKNDVEILKCGHQFHYGCIQEWLKKKDTCPICRTKRPELGLPEGKEDIKEPRNNWNDDFKDDDGYRGSYVYTPEPFFYFTRRSLYGQYSDIVDSEGNFRTYETDSSSSGGYSSGSSFSGGFSSGGRGGSW